MHYPNTIRSHLVTIVPMAPFTLKCTSKLRSALHIRYSKVIPRFISRANTAQIVLNIYSKVAVITETLLYIGISNPIYAPLQMDL